MSSLPPPVKRFEIETLPAETRERLRAVAAKAGTGSVVGRDNLGGELGWVLLGLTITGLNFVLALGHPSGDWLRFALQSTLGVPFIFWGGRKLLRRRRIGIPTFLHPLPAYFIGLDGAHVVFWSWASASQITLTDRLLNGAYMGTDVSVDFGDRSLTVGSANRESAARLAAEYGGFRDRARSYAQQGRWHELEGADVLPLEAFG